jgi:hypothetical protein
MLLFGSNPEIVSAFRQTIRGIVLVVREYSLDFDLEQYGSTQELFLPLPWQKPL